MRSLQHSRRDFIKSSALAATGLIVAFRLPHKISAATGLPVPADFSPSAFLRIAPDETITIIAKHDEMGQGVHTSLAMVIAEELEADFSRIRVEPAMADDVYKHVIFGIQMTGGSTSTWSSYEQMRQAGATAREMLISAAAAKWNAKRSDCFAENGFIIHRPSQKRISFGKLAEGAARLTPPTEVKLKDPKDFKIIGKSVKRVDSEVKVTGKAIFSIDVRVPGMLSAVIARPAYFDGKLKKLNADKAKAMPGVKAIIEVPRGVAVIAETFWQAKQAREALELDWEPGAMAKLSSASLRDQYAELAKKTGLSARNEGDASKAFEGTTKTIEATYEAPFLAHAPMEPLSCLVTLTNDKCEIVTGSQFLGPDRLAAAQVLGWKAEQISIRNTYLGGGFGRRANPASDFVREAVEVAKAAKHLNAPIKTIWTREDDIRGGYYRPYWYNKLAAALDSQGNLIGWKHTIVGQSILNGTPFESMMVKDGIDATSVEGAANLPYHIPNILVELHSPKIPVPVLWWRSVGSSYTAYVTECFLDEVAAAAGKDPYELRRTLLKDHPRHRRVLELAAQKADWGEPLPKGVGRGIAVHESFGSFVAQVAEVSMDEEEGTPVVRRVVCAVDCGPVVNPDTVKAQMEGCVGFGLSAALAGKITFADGQVEQSNFHDYPPIRIKQMPKVEVYIVDTTDKMGGVGEPGVPPVAPAVCNALFALTGKRIRQLPIERQAA